jgi:hypothetical protein
MDLLNKFNYYWYSAHYLVFPNDDIVLKLILIYLNLLKHGFPSHRAVICRPEVPSQDFIVPLAQIFFVPVDKPGDNTGRPCADVTDWQEDSVLTLQIHAGILIIVEVVFLLTSGLSSHPLQRASGCLFKLASSKSFIVLSDSLLLG